MLPLTFHPSGAVVAAATTSLPEELGADDNYDYRFVPLRDPNMTVQAQWVAACPDEPARFLDWLTAAIGVLDGDDPQIMYGFEGEQIVTEQELAHLDGFAGSRPAGSATPLGNSDSSMSWARCSTPPT